MIQHRIKEREPQYMDMKEIIAEAARKLILEKKVKKLTVKGYCGRVPDHQAGILLPFRRNTGYDSVEHKAGNQAAAGGVQKSRAAQKQR